MIEWLPTVADTAPGSPWNPVSVTTAAMSALALVLSGTTLVLNQWFRPRSHFEIEWEEIVGQTEYGVLTAGCWIWNDGDATARNVRLNIRHPQVHTTDKDLRRWHEYEPGQGRSYLEVPVEPASFTRSGLGPENVLLLRTGPLPEYAKGLPDGAPWERQTVIRPTVEIRYRGRIRPIRWRAPEPGRTPVIGGC